MKKDYPCLLLSAVVETAGFYAIDLSSATCQPGEHDYCNYWVNGKTPERLDIAAAPPITIDVGLDFQGNRRTWCSRAGVTLTDDSPSVLLGFVQRQFVVYARNKLLPSELPAFISPSPSGPASALKIRFTPAARTFWDSPDVRLNLARQRSFLSRLHQTMAGRYDWVRDADQKPHDPTVEHERVARTTPLRSGLYLPVSLETVAGNVDAVLRLDSNVATGDAQGTLFSEAPLTRLESGTRLVRHAVFVDADHREEATDLVGVIT